MENSFFKQNTKRSTQTANSNLDELESMKERTEFEEANELNEKMADIQNKMAELKKANEQLKHAVDQH